MSIIEAALFERDLTLQELIDNRKRAALAGIFQSAVAECGGSLWLEDLDGQIVVGRAPSDRLDHKQTHPLHLTGQLMPIGRCVAVQVPPSLFRTVYALVKLLLNSQARYKLAADLYEKVVLVDYETLKEANRSLAESEAQYKALAHSLEQKVAEQVAAIETRQRQLYHQDRLASLGQLAGGVAHEINTPLGFIKSNVHTAIQYLAQIERSFQASGEFPALGPRLDDLAPILEDFHSLLAETCEGVERVARIVADLKQCSQTDKGIMESTDINEVVKTALNVVAHELKYRVEVITHFGELPMFPCHSGRLNQVFLHLLLNAVQAIPEHGVITVCTTSRDKTIMVSVADTGIGIAPDVLPRIFDPFFTTKAVGKGTGLGLTISHEIIKAHDGSIHVDSQPGHGTTFTIVLPAPHDSVPDS